MAEHGGKRERSGRKTGSPNIATAAIRASACHAQGMSRILFLTAAQFTKPEQTTGAQHNLLTQPPLTSR